MSLMGGAGQFRFLGVVAPAGFGKSTLVKQWLDTNQTSACWLTLDRSDNRPVIFWRYLLECLNRAGIDVSSIKEIDPDTDTQALVSGLINQLGRNTDNHLTLVLDDFHHIQDSGILEGITFFIDFAPTNFTLMLTSRTEPAFPFARWKVKRFARVLYSADLIFNSEETGKLLANSLGLDFDASQLDQILKTTGGWAAALQLLAHGTLPTTSESIGEQDLTKALSSNRRDIEDYIAQEVLDDLPDDLRDFILKLAPASRFDAAISNAVRNASDSHEHIAKLESRNLFLIALDDQGHWFRFHELLRDGALHYLRTQQPDLLLQYSQRVIDYHLQTKHFIEAIELIIDLGAWNLLISTLEDIGNSLIRQGYHLNIIEALQQAPEELVGESAKLQVIRLWCLFYNNQFNEIPPLLKSVRRRLTEADLATSLKLELDLLEAYMARFSKDVERARSITEAVLSQLEESSAPVKSLAYFGLGNDYFALGSYDEAEKALKEAITQGKLEQRFSTVKSSLGLLLWIYQIRGEFIRALDLFRQVEVWIKSYHRDDPDPNTVSCWLNSALVLIYIEQQQLQHAAGYLYPMINLMETAEPLQKMLFYYVQGEYQYRMQETDLALRSFDQAQSLLDQNFEELLPFAPPIQAAKAEVILSSNTLDDTSPLVDFTLQQQNQMSQYSPFWNFKLLEVKAIKLLHESSESALTAGDELITFGESYRAPKSLALGYLVKSSCYKQMGMEAESKEQLLVALRYGEQNDYIRMFQQAFSDLNFDIASLKNEGIAQAFLDSVSGLANEPLNPQPEPAIAVIPAATSQEGPRITVQGATTASSSTLGAISLTEPLSKRELEVLLLIDQGLPNKKIADKLSLAPATVKAHIRNIYSKINASSRTDALAKARTLGVIR